MSHHEETRRPVILTVVFLTIVTSFLLVVRPGQLAIEGPFHWLTIMATLGGVYSLYLAGWKNHGCLFGMAAVFLLIDTDPACPEFPEEAAWLLTQLLFLACVGIHLIAWSGLNRREQSVSFWIIMISCSVITSALIWVEAQQTAQRFSTLPSDGWATVDQRMRNCSFVFLVLGGFLSVQPREQRKLMNWLWLAACLLAPIVGLGLANLYVPARLEHVFQGARWDRLVDDVQAWSSAPDLTSRMAQWCWTAPWLVMVLAGVGFWRAIARGLRQRRQGMLPQAKLLALAVLLLLGALLPYSSGSKPLGLIWAGIALPVFAIADLGLLFYEQLALPMPEPSSAPHV
jgi:hypothetical protein